MQENNPKTNPSDFPHLGRLINFTLYQKRIKKKEVAQYLGLNPVAISTMVKKSSIQTETLWHICQSTNHNFFAFLSEKIGIPYPTTAENDLKLKISLLEQQIYDLQKENQLLKEIMKR